MQDQTLSPPPKRPAWPAVISLGLGIFAIVTSEFLPASLLSRMAVDLTVSEGLAGQAVTATAIAGALISPVTTILAGRIDRKFVILGLSALLVLSNAMVFFSTSLWTLLAARVLLGITLGGFWSLSAAMAARLVPPHLFGRAMSVILTGVSVATICAVPAGAFLGELWGWRLVFAIAGGIGVVSLVVQLLCLPRLPAIGRASIAGIFDAARIPAVQLCLCVCLLVGAGHFAAFTYIRPFLEQVGGLSAATLSLVLLAFGLAAFVGNLAAGYLVGRNLLLTAAGAPILIGLSILALASLGETIAGSSASIVVWGLAFGALPIGLNTWMAKAAPDALESVGGIFISSFQVAIALGSAAGGLAVDSLGVRTTLAIAGAVGLSAGLLFWIAGRQRLGALTPPRA